MRRNGCIHGLSAASAYALRTNSFEVFLVSFMLDPPASLTESGLSFKLNRLPGAFHSTNAPEINLAHFLLMFCYVRPHNL